MWSLDTDDWHGIHSEGTYPLIKSINSALASGQTFMPSHPCTGSAPMCDLPTKKKQTAPRHNV